MKNNVAIIVLAAAAVALNVTVGSAVYLLKLPVYLDSIGIMLVAIMMPGTRLQAFWIAASVGVISFVIGGILVNPFLPWFSLTAIAGAAYGAFVVRGRIDPATAENKGSGFSLVWRVLVFGIGWGLVAALISAPVVVYLFGGVTGSGTTLVLAFLLKTGQQLLSAAILTGLAAEPVDKTLQMLCAILISRATPANFRQHLTPR